MAPSLLVLSASDVLKASSSLSPEHLMRLMANAFFNLSNGKGVESPQRIAIDNDSNLRRTLFMPTHADGYGTAIKIVSLSTGTTVNSTSQQTGLNASTLVLDEETGAVKALLNARYLTSLRTAAGSCLATKLLFKQNPSVIVAFGAGDQIQAHLQLLLSTYPSLKECIIINRTRNDRLLHLKGKLKSLFPQTSFACEGASYGNKDDDARLRQIVSRADIICSATPSRKVLFNSAWVKPGTHINLVGSYTVDMREVDEEVIRRAAKIVVDSREACLHEAGELIHANLRPEDLVEIGELVNAEGEVLGNIVDGTRNGDVTIFKSVGVGIQDVAIAQAVLERAHESGIGVKIDNYDAQ